MGLHMPTVDFSRRQTTSLRRCDELPRLRPVLVDLADARAYLGNISRRHIYDLAKEGKIRLVGNRRKRWAFLDSLDEYIASLAAE